MTFGALMTNEDDPPDTPAAGSLKDAWRLMLRLLGLLAPHWKSLLVGLLLLALGAVCVTAGPWLIKRAIDVDIAQGNLRGLALTCGIFLLLQGMVLGTRLVQAILLERVGQQVVGRLREQLFSHLLYSPVSYHDANPPGKLISRVESDTEQLRRMLSSAVVALLGSLMLFIAMFAVMATVDLVLTAVVALIVALLLSATFWIQKSTAKRYIQVRQKMADLTGKLTEWLQGTSVLQTLRQEASASAQLREANIEKFELEYQVERRICAFWNLIFLVEALGVAVLLGLGGWRALHYGVSIGAIVMFIEYLRRLFEPIHQLAHELQSFMEAFAGARMIFDLLDEPLQTPDPPTPIAWSGLTGAIAFENVWFAYNGDDWVLRDVSFQIPVGQHWAMVGVTGSGKSTIVSLLLRFYEPTRGRITVDGIDIREIEREALRSRIGFVPQDLYLFPGSVLDNLRLGEGIEAEQAIAAAESLQVDRFISGLPESFETEVAERGMNFSAGERQLLCATRALVAAPEILILDEATSAVDPQTEREVQQALRQLLEGRTTLTVAHRLTTILGSDKILVLDAGKLLEQGSHTELLEADGFYSRLFALQFTGNGA